MATTASGSYSITAFALMRTAVGVSGLLIPTQAASFFGIDASYGSRIVFRLFGVRELALGGMMWYAQRLAEATTTAVTKSATESSQLKAPQHLALALWIGLFIDVVDMFSSAACILEGSMAGRAIWLVGAGAGFFAALGGHGLVAVA